MHRILLVEDVVTTGNSTITAAQRLRIFGYKVDTVFSLVDREAGGEKNFNANQLSLFSLFDLSDFPITSTFEEKARCEKQ